MKFSNRALVAVISLSTKNCIYPTNFSPASIPSSVSGLHRKKVVVSFFSEKARFVYKITTLLSNRLFKVGNLWFFNVYWLMVYWLWCMQYCQLFSSSHWPYAVAQSSVFLWLLFLNALLSWIHALFLCCYISSLFLLWLFVFLDRWLVWFFLWFDSFIYYLSVFDCYYCFRCISYSLFSLRSFQRAVSWAYAGFLASSYQAVVWSIKGNPKHNQIHAILLKDI